jgi:hypothetical protein
LIFMFVVCQTSLVLGSNQWCLSEPKVVSIEKI